MLGLREVYNGLMIVGGAERGRKIQAAMIGECLFKNYSRNDF